ncbi:MAG: EamA family transporter [Candidatus Omnitrophica bacterium]|nr:EamA family transporter [Candidatus Omnitrophota bacterium]
MMWIPLILLTAFFISLQDVFGKKIISRVDPCVVAWAWFFFSLPLLVVCLAVNGIPPLGPLFWKALIIAAVFLTIASIFYFKAIKFSDLSLAVPMLAFTPLFLLVTSPVILGEFPGPLGLMGIILIVIGSYVLHLQERHKSFWEPFRMLVREKGVRYMLMVAVLYSISGNIDKIGVIHSSPFMWIFMMNLMLAATLTLVMARNVTGIQQQIKEVWPFLVVLGFCNGLAHIFQMIAIKMTIIPYLIAVKRTSVIMTSLFGLFLFKEKGLRERLLGAILMILGVFLISFAR